MRNLVADPRIEEHVRASYKNRSGIPIRNTPSLPASNLDTRNSDAPQNSETVASKPSYREPWKKRRYALVPMAAFYEPDYETGKALRWKIERHDKRAFTVAAIWDYWKRPTGEGLHSFSMLTINADDHPVMGRFHKPGDEKRSLVIVPPERRDEWLHATPEHANRILLPLPAEEFTACPAPIKPHKTA